MRVPMRALAGFRLGLALACAGAMSACGGGGGGNGDNATPPSSAPAARGSAASSRSDPAQHRAHRALLSQRPLRHTDGRHQILRASRHQSGRVVSELPGWERHQVRRPAPALWRPIRRQGDRARQRCGLSRQPQHDGDSLQPLAGGQAGAVAGAMSGRRGSCPQSCPQSKRFLGP
jgi:hypothetical protein